MKKNHIILIIFTLILCDTYAQNKPVYERIEEYNNSKDEKELISIGYALPFFLSKKNEANKKSSWSDEREKVIQYHVEWLNHIFDSNFNSKGFTPPCYSWNVVSGPNEELEKQRLQNKKNCIIHQKKLVYERVIKRFHFFYNRSFLQEGESMEELEAIIDKIAAEKTAKNKDRIIEAIRLGFKEQENK